MCATAVCAGFALLHYAAKWDRVDVIELLLSNCANKGVEDFSGVWQCHFACRVSDLKFVLQVVHL